MSSAIYRFYPLEKMIEKETRELRNPSSMLKVARVGRKFFVLGGMGTSPDTFIQIYSPYKNDIISAPTEYIEQFQT